MRNKTIARMLGKKKKNVQSDKVLYPPSLGFITSTMLLWLHCKAREKRSWLFVC